MSVVPTQIETLTCTADWMICESWSVRFFVECLPCKLFIENDNIQGFSAVKQPFYLSALKPLKPFNSDMHVSVNS